MRARHGGHRSTERNGAEEKKNGAEEKKREHEQAWGEAATERYTWQEGSQDRRQQLGGTGRNWAVLLLPPHPAPRVTLRMTSPSQTALRNADTQGSMPSLGSAGVPRSLASSSKGAESNINGEVQIAAASAISSTKVTPTSISTAGSVLSGIIRKANDTQTNLTAVMSCEADVPFTVRVCRGVGTLQKLKAPESGGTHECSSFLMTSDAEKIGRETPTQLGTSCETASLFERNSSTDVLPAIGSQAVTTRHDDVEGEVWIEIDVWCGRYGEEELCCQGAISTAGQLWKTRKGAEWKEELPTGIKIRDLPSDAELHVRLVSHVAAGNDTGNDGNDIYSSSTNATQALHPSFAGSFSSLTMDPHFQSNPSGKRRQVKALSETAVLRLFTKRGRRLRSGEYRLHLTRDSRNRYNELDRIERILRKCRRGVVQTGSPWLEGKISDLITSMRQNERENSDGLVIVIELPSFEYPIVYQDTMEIYRTPIDQFDPEDSDIPTPAEAKARKLTRSVMADPRSKPDGAEREAIAEILRQPPAHVLTGQEQQLLWRFRNTLTAEPKALSKFLRAVDWDDVSEAKQAADLAERWAPIPTSSALELLGPIFSNARIRQLAVNVLAGMDDEELRCYLLQLVAALRYEENIASSPLAAFLVSRASQSPVIACYLHWYLLVECDDPVHGYKFDRIHERFVEAQRSDISGEIVLEGIRMASELMSQLCAIMRDLKMVRGATAKKAERLKILLSAAGPFGELAMLGNPGPPCPLDPRIRINGLIPDQSGVFKSALHPLRLAFRTTDGETYKAIFKKGDDLRQDQLVVQMIALMDRLLKRENLDLQLTPYAVIATGLSEGLVEFVPSTPLSQVLEKFKTIPKFLASHYPDSEGPMSMQSDVHESFIRSCAGSCVVTYILGVGDRHLDNLMLTCEGKLFHIDFGYIMGRDPKPFAPPVKLCREMVEAMGGVDSSGYDRFRLYCCEAFNILRKSSNLILNLIMLMSEASIPDISVDPERTLLKLQEKLCLDVDDEEASQFFQGVLNESATALFPNLVETAHRFAQYWR